MRKLATIATIDAISHHTNADQLELATVRGWVTVVKKGEYKVGDKCIYVEIDSVLPDKKEFEFLRDRGFRVKTIKLRGELSQGIVFPLSIISGDFCVGDDVTDVLGVKLCSDDVSYDDASIVGSFPDFINKTGCERIQNHLYILNKYINNEWVATEKLDGSSLTVYCLNGELHVCSRNYELNNIEGSMYWDAVKDSCIDESIEGYALQGELIGVKVNGNRYNLSNRKLYIFDVFDIKNQCYLDFDDYRKFCSWRGIDTVPVIRYKEKIHSRMSDILTNANSMMSDILTDANGRSAINDRVDREGLVWKPLYEMTDHRIGGRVSFKVISNKYLLNY